MDGLLCAHTSIFIVADDTAKKTIVGRRDIVVVVEQDGGQCRGIHTENLLVRNLRRQLRVQGMDAFHHQDIVVVHLQLLATLLALARLEIVLRQFHLLATEEGIKLVVDELQVERIDTLIIILAICILWRFLPIHEVIIQGNLQRFQAVHSQLDGETLTRGGLARRGRTCQENEFHALAVGDVFGYLGDFLLLQSLADIDDVGGESSIHSLVEVTHRTDAQNVLPTMVLLEDLKHLVLLGQFAQYARVLDRRNAEQHTIIILLQAEEIQLGSIGEKRAIIEIDIFTYLIIGSVDGARGLEEFHLLHVTLLLEEGDGFLRRHHVSTDRHLGIDDLLHTLANPIDILIGSRATKAHIHIEAIRHRDVDDDIVGRIKVLHRLAEHKEERAGVGTRARRRSHVEELHILIIIHTIMKTFHLIIHLTRHRSILHLETKCRKNIKKCASDFYFLRFFIIFATDLYHLFHLRYVRVTMLDNLFTLK